MFLGSLEPLLFIRISSSFPKKLVQMKIHWIFRVVSLFNYQGCLLLSKRLRYFIITCFVCQALFSSFLNFFVWSFSNRRAFWQLRYFIISFSVCQVFFEVFLTFFFHPTASSFQLLVGCLLLVFNSFGSLPCTRLFVKYFFKNFFDVFETEKEGFEPSRRY